MHRYFSLALMIVGFASNCLAQFEAYLWAFNQLTTECNGGTPIEDGCVAVIYWDSDDDGADSEDPLPIVGAEIGEYNYRSFLINGSELFGFPGAFYTEIPFANLSATPQPSRYYVVVECGQARWVSSVFSLQSGFNDVDLSELWICGQSQVAKCCMSNQGCDDLSEPECDLAAGTWYLGETCSGSSCSIDEVWRCCYGQGTCSDTTLAACNSLQGEWSQGVLCNADSCLNSEIGRCCYGNFDCIDTTLIGCANLGGQWSQNVSCNESACEPLGPAPEFDLVWNRTIGGTGQEMLGGPEFEECRVIATLDGGSLVAGYTQSFGASLNDAYVVRLTSNGDTLWTRRFGGNGNDYLTSGLQLPDGSFVLAGSNSSSGNSCQGYLVKIDPAGQLLWSRTHGNSSCEEYRDVIRSSNGSFMAIGSRDPVSGLQREVYITSSDSSGNLIWERTLGRVYTDNGMTIAIESDTTFIFAGFSYGGDGIHNDIIVGRIGQSGQVLALEYYDSPEDDRVYSIIKSKFGGAIVCGWGWSDEWGGGGRGFVSRIDLATLLPVWTAEYLGPTYTKLYDIKENSEGYLMAVGLSANPGNGTDDFSITCLSGTGQFQWNRRIDGLKAESARSLDLTPDDDIILAGYTESFGAGGRDIMVSKFGATTRDVLLHPTGGQVLFAGDTLNIVWYANQPSEPVSLDINRDFPLGAWASVAVGTENDGIFPWLVTQPESQFSRLRVSRTSEPESADTSRSDFRINSPVIQIASPNGGETYYLSGAISVSWTCNLPGDVRIDLNRAYPDGEWELLTAATANDGLENIVVAGQATESARIRISSVIRPWLADTSNSNFAIRSPSVFVSSPNGTENWGVGNAVTISWTSSNLIGNVSIEINRSFPSAAWESISSSTPNDGSYSWTVTSPTTSSARLRVRSSSAPTVGDSSDANFSIVYPFIQLLSPNGGEFAAVGHPYNIQWASTNLTQSVRIELNRTFPGGSWTTLTSGTPNTGVYTWNVSGSTSATSRIRVSPTNISTSVVSDTSDANFSIVTPVISVSAPNGGEVIEIGSTTELTWTSSNLPGNVSIEINRSYPSANWTSVVASTENDGLYSWLVSYPSSLAARIRVRSVGIPSVGDTSNLNFNIPAPPADSLPGLASNPIPPDGDAYIPESQVLTWSPVARATAYDLYLWRSTYNEPDTPTVSTSDIYFDPNLLPGTTYSWKVRARNLYGETLSPIWTFTTRALPDLQVTDIVYPQEIFSGQTIQIQWTISNLGAGPTVTPQWNDFVFVSQDLDFRPADPLDSQWGGFPNIMYLEPGQSYVQTQTITLPANKVGYYYLGVVTDDCEALNIDTVNWYATGPHCRGPVSESNNNNNFNFRPVEIQPSSTPDLRITATNVPAILTSGAQAVVSWTVQNQGEVAASGSWYDAVYISDDSSFSQNDARLLLLPPPQPILLPDSSYVISMSVTIPNATSGPRWIIFRTDATESTWEFVGDNNNFAYSSSRDVILSPWPDFVVTHFVAEPTVATGYPVNMEWTVANQGAGQPFEASWNDRVYLSDSQILNPSTNVVLGTYLRTGSLEPGNEYNREVSPVIPVSQAPGVYYLHLVTDFNNTVFENGDDNNNSANPPLQVTVYSSLLPDLEATSLAAAGQLQAGQSATFTYRVTNVGDTATPSTAWTERIAVSDIPFLTPQATQLALQSRQSSLGPAAYYDNQVSISIPTGLAGRQYLFLIVDNGEVVYEGLAETNNAFTLQTTVEPYPPVDLAIGNLNYPDSASSGTEIDLSWTVNNEGEGRTLANSWQDAMYLSADQIYQSGQDIRVNSSRHDGALNPNQNYDRSVVATLPNGVSGDFYVIGKTDTALVTQDNNTLNNSVVSSGMIHVSLTPWADLVVTAIVAASEDTAGQPTSVQWTVQNVGPTATPVTRWYDAVYLSFNRQVDAGDILLGPYERTGTLAPNESYSRQVDITIPGYANGNYFLLVKTDSRDDIFEYQSEANNVNSESFVATVPPLCDLVVTNVQGPDSAILGDEIMVSYEVRNIGSSAVTGWSRDGVYLSKDSTRFLIGFVDYFINIEPGSLLSVMDTLKTVLQEGRSGDAALDDEPASQSHDLQALSPGNYAVSVNVDLRNTFRESDEQFNSGNGQDSLTINVAKLDIGAVDTRIVSGDGVIYFVIDTVGLSQSVSVAAHYTGGACHLQARIGGVPELNNADFESSYPPRNTADLSFRTSGSPVFFALNYSNQDGDPDTIQVACYEDTLGITTFFPQEFSNHSEVTLELSGSGFSESTSIVLEGNDNLSRAKSIYYETPSRLFATFDVLGISPGLYSLSAFQTHESMIETNDSLNPFAYIVDTVIASCATQAAVTSVFRDSLSVIVKLPDVVRLGFSFPVSITIANLGTNDVYAPILYLADAPELRFAFGNDITPSANLQRIYAFSPDGPPGIIRAGQSFTISGTATQTNRGTGLHYLSALPVNETQLSLNDLLGRIGITTETDDYQFLASLHFSDSVGTWPQLLSYISNTANEFQLRHANFDDQWSAVVSEFIRRNIPDASSDTVFIPPWQVDQVDDSASSREDCIWMTPWGQGTCVGIMAAAYATFVVNRHWLSAAYLQRWAGLDWGAPNQPTGWLPGSSVSEEARRLPSFRGKIHPAVVEGSSGFDGYRKLVESALREANSCPSPVDFPVVSNLQQVSGAKLEFPYGEYKEAFHDMDFYPDDPDWPSPDTQHRDGSQVMIESITCLPGESECEVGETIHYHATLLYLFRDVYQFAPSFWDCGVVYPACLCGDCLEDHGQGHPFVTAIFVREEFEGDVEIERTEECCDPSNQCCDGAGDSRCDCVGSSCDSSNVVGPVDPNEIVGKSGYGQASHVNILPLAINVYFENDPDLATAPAQVVHIELPIDSSLDPRSFRLGSFGFGQHFFNIPSNRSSYSQRLDLRDSLGLYVDFTAGVNLQTRELYWNFESIDPNTGLPPIDPLSGFLPVNDSLGRGQGFVTFTMEPNTDAQTGEEITAQASIVFDINAPIETNTWLNTIDSGPPVSTMDTTVEFIDSLQFRLSWSGQDDSLGSGIAYYDLYCSVNEAPFIVVGDSLFDTTLTVRADWYNTYHFFALATDNVGNQEAMKPAGEITVEIGSAPGTIWVDSLVIEIDETDSGKFAQLFWPPYMPDSSDDQVGYWIYSRSNIGHDNAWYFAADAQDTTTSFLVVPSRQVVARFFLVVAYTYASIQGGTTRPRPVPVINVPEVLFTPEISATQSTVVSPDMRTDSTMQILKIPPADTYRKKQTNPDAKTSENESLKTRKHKR